MSGVATKSWACICAIDNVALTLLHFNKIFTKKIVVVLLSNYNVEGFIPIYCEFTL